MFNARKFTRIRQRLCGGWIGIFDDGDLRFGVTGISHGAVEVGLSEALSRWRRPDDGGAGASNGTHTPP